MPTAISLPIHKNHPQEPKITQHENPFHISADESLLALKLVDQREQVTILTVLCCIDAKNIH